MNNSARTVLAIICIAATVMFAAASTASLVDQVQHGTGSPHEHGLHMAFSQVHADHGSDTAASQDAGESDDQGSVGHHHHGDGLTGALSGSAPSAVVARSTEAIRLAPNPEGLKSIRPGGLERPPKDLAKLV